MRFISKFGRDRHGIAAIEFAMLAPVIVLIGLGTMDLASGADSQKRTRLAAETVAQLATSFAVVARDVNVLSSANATLATNVVYALLDGVNDPSPPPFGIALTSVVMVPTPPGCTSSCNYVGAVAWSGNFGGSLGAGLVRPCGTVLTAAPDSAPPNKLTLPTSAFTPAPILVADLAYVDTPLFLGELGVIPLATVFGTNFSAYFALRTGAKNDNAWVSYPDKADTRVTSCPNYP